MACGRHEAVTRLYIAGLILPVSARILWGVLVAYSRYANHNRPSGVPSSFHINRRRNFCNIQPLSGIAVVFLKRGPSTEPASIVPDGMPSAGGEDVMLVCPQCSISPQCYFNVSATSLYYADMFSVVEALVSTCVLPCTLPPSRGTNSCLHRILFPCSEATCLWQCTFACLIRIRPRPCRWRLAGTTRFQVETVEPGLG